MGLDRYLSPPRGQRTATRTRLRRLREQLGSARTASAALDELLRDPDPHLIAPMLQGVVLADGCAQPAGFFLRDGRWFQGTLAASLQYLLAEAPPMFSIISDFQALDALDLSRLPLYRGVGPLAKLRGLRTLTARDATGSFRDVGALGSLPRLVALDLHGADFQGDLSGLSGSETLHTLHLDGIRPDLRLPDLRHLPALRHLSLPPSTRRKTLRPLRSVPALVSLVVPDRTALTDITALVAHTGLQHLSLRGCSALRDLSPLRGLDALVSVDLSGCRAVRDTRPLLSLPRLEQLDLGRTPAAMTFSRAPTVLQSRPAVSVYLRRVARGTFRSRRASLEQQYRRLRSLLHADDPGQQDQGLEILAALDDPELLDLFVQGSHVVAGRLHAGPALLRGGQHPHEALDIALLRALQAAAPHPMLQEAASIQQLTLDNASNTALAGLQPLTGLQKLRMIAMQDVTDLSWLSPLESLEALTLQACPRLERLDGLRTGRLQAVSLKLLGALEHIEIHAPRLEQLTISRCGALQHVTLHAPRLRTLICDHLPRLAALTLHAPALETARLWELHSLSDLELESDALNTVDLDQFNVMRRLPAALVDGVGLKRLSLSRMYALEGLPDLSGCGKLDTLSMYDLPLVTGLPALPPGLRTLRLENLSGLADISGMATGSGLESLLLRNTASVRSGLRTIADLPSLRSCEVRAAGALNNLLGRDPLVLDGADVPDQLSALAKP